MESMKPKASFRPRMIPCPTCGREYGVASLPIHQKSCAKSRLTPSNQGSMLSKNSNSIKTGAKLITQTQKAPVSLNPSLRPNSFNALSDVPIQKKGSRPQMNYAELSQPSGKDERVACRKCKRKFNPDRINKHQSVCIGPINEVPKKVPPKIIKRKKNGGMPVWKKQHLDFINNIRYAKKMQMIDKFGGDIKSIAPPVQHYDPTSDYKQCPYCSRKYSQVAAERHIPMCKNIINKPKPPPRQVIVKETVKPVMKKEIRTGPGYCPRCGAKVPLGARKCNYC